MNVSDIKAVRAEFKWPLIIHLEGKFRSQVLYRPTKMCTCLACVRQDSKHDTYFSTLLAWRMSPCPTQTGVS